MSNLLILYRGEFMKSKKIIAAISSLAFLLQTVPMQVFAEDTADVTPEAVQTETVQETEQGGTDSEQSEEEASEENNDSSEDELTAEELDEIIGSYELPENGFGFIELTPEQTEALVRFADEENAQYEGTYSTYKAALYTYSNNYYRDQLNTEEKRIYDEFVDMCTEFMTSSETTSHYYLDYIEYDSSKVSKTRAGQIAQLAYYSHPEFFFLENGSVSGSYSDGKTCILSPYVNTYFGSASVRSDAYNKITTVTNSWMNELKALPNDLEKETRIAEKICDTVTYIRNDFDQSLYGSLICEQAVCNGYAMMMNYFCNAAGINCITVVSDSHAWNNVQLFNDWYVTDTTWMDQETYIYYDWLNIDNATMLKQDSGQSHVVESDAYVGITLPSCTKTNPTVPAVTAPALPTVKATAGNSQVALSWNAVANATRYSVFYRKTGTSSWTAKPVTSTSYTVTGLTNGTKYDFLVLSYVGNTASKWTNANIVTATPTAPVAAPALPTVKATAGNAQVALSWNAVANATKYSVFYRKTGTSSWTAKPVTATSYTVTGLTNGTKYDFLVLSYVGNTASKWTNANIVTATPTDHSVK